MWPNLNHSLRITLGISLAILLMQGILSYVVFDNFRTAIRGNVEKQQFALVTTLAREIDDKIQGHLRLLTEIATMAPADVLIGDSRGNVFLEKHAEMTSVFDHGLFLFTPAGRLVGEFPRRSTDRQAVDFPYRRHIKEVIATRRPLVSQPYRSSIDGRPVVTFVVPLLNGDGSLRGILEGTLSLLHDNFLSNVAHTRIGNSGYLYLFGKDRVLIAHPDRSRILQKDVPYGANALFDRATEGFEGGGETVSSKGVRNVAAFKRLKAAPWILSANFPVGEAYAPLRTAIRNLLIAFSVTILALGVALCLIVRRMKGEVARRAEAEGYTDLLLESVGEGVIGITRAGCISFINKGALQLLGYQSAEELLGRDARHLLNHATADCLQCAREKCLLYPALAVGVVQRSENVVLWCKDDSSFVSDFSCSSVCGGVNLQGAVIGFRDISERKVTEERLRLQAAALEAAANSVIMLDRSAKIIWVNRSFTKLTGYSREEAIGCTPFSLLGSYDKERMKNLTMTVNSKLAWHGEMRSRRKDGVLYDEDVTITPMLDADGEITHFIGIMQEVTERKLFEEALLQSNLAFEEANSRLKQSIERANELAVKAEQANCAKSDFLANMSHEIRTPMNAIIGISHLLQGTKLTLKQTDYLQTLTISAELLLGLINDILDFSKIEAGKLEIDRVEFSVEEVLAEFMAVFAARAEEKGLELRAHLDPAIPGTLLGDPQRLAQVLNNLLGNSLKFTRHGFVALSVSVVQPGADFVELEFVVQDSGIGIELRHQAQLFEPFTQVDGSITRTYGGTGLGLAICKRLVTLMGGRIWCDSSPGVGSAFCFRLPFAVASAESVATARGVSPIVPTLFNGERILLVEDNLFNQKVAISLLEKRGLRVTVANNGVEAVALIGKRKFDLVLMDIQMPDMDGLTAARRIRELEKPGAAAIPILAVSANAMEKDVRESLAAGMNAHITKPFTPETLYEALSFWLGAGAGETVGKTLRLQPGKMAREEISLREPSGLLDVEAGIRQIGGDRDLYRDLLGKFLSEYGNKLEEIGREVVNGNLQHAAHIAHSVKGIAGVLAAMPLQLAAQKLETALTKDNHAIEPLVQAFREELTATLSFVDAELAAR